MGLVSGQPGRRCRNGAITNVLLQNLSSVRRLTHAYHFNTPSKRPNRIERTATNLRLLSRNCQPNWTANRLSS